MNCCGTTLLFLAGFLLCLLSCHIVTTKSGSWLESYDGTNHTHGMSSTEGTVTSVIKSTEETATDLVSKSSNETVTWVNSNEETLIKKVKWVKSNQVNLSELEPAGKERSERDNHITLYVARGSYNRYSIMPGKYNDKFDRAYTSFEGKVIDFKQYEFLVAPVGALSWVPGAGQNVPENLIYGGSHPRTMERLYVCRGLDSKYLITGWYSYNEGICSVSWDDREYKTKRFEVLILNAYGQAINAGKADSEGTWQI